MKTLITTLNAKYIHTSAAVRLLYLAAKKEGHDALFREYTIRDDPFRIADEIAGNNVDTAAFACYIWNIEPTITVVKRLKEMRPALRIVLGGPEVTWDAEHFLAVSGADAVIRGEGEEVFPQLLTRFETGDDTPLPGVAFPGLPTDTVLSCPVSYVESLGFACDLPEDIPTRPSRVVYVETSRGCPHHCAYCLSSLEKGLRFFSRPWLSEQLSRVCAGGAKTVKLLDRSFCASSEHALWVLRFLAEHHAPDQVFQFEINADTMPAEVTDWIVREAPAGLFRFEVGIQSTYEPSNRAVSRLQDFEKLSRTVTRLLECGRCVLHLDLIAGLPLESFDRFAGSFDAVFAFRTPELQLGFLKLLRGTALRNRAGDYGYVFGERPPYEITRSLWMSAADLAKIHIAEDMLEKYWNSGRFPTALPAILEHVPSPFRFFLELGLYCEKAGCPAVGFQPHDLFRCIDDFTGGRYREALLRDYYRLFRTRPKRFCPPSVTGRDKRMLLHALAEALSLPEDILFRYATCEILTDSILLVMYRDGVLDLREIPKTLLPEIMPAP